MDTYQSLGGAELDRFIGRSKASAALPAEPDFGLVLRQILQKAGELVPSESGAILLDDPLSKVAMREKNRLCFVAAFGPAAHQVLGRSIDASEGVAGRVYRTGEAHLSVETDRDATFADRVDRDTGYRTRSIIAAPILIGQTVCGTIELLNRVDGRPYDDQDRLLLEVFASYTASSLQNALDARHAQELAKVDDLTGLFNDRYLHGRLAEELRRAREAGLPCALLFVDLDHFKPVNDVHGHLVGSQVLREIGYLLRRVTADQGAVLARYGGDEFTVVLPGRTADQACVIAETIREAIGRAVFLERSHGPDLPALRLRGAVTTSIGVAAIDPAASTPGDPSAWLMREADQAMYRAKAGGKNRVCVADGAARP